MKKVGIIVFIAAILIGVVFSNFTSFGKAQLSFFKISFNDGIRGSGNIVTENREISGFKSVDVGGIFQVEITAQKEFSVAVEADDNLLPFIKTEVNDGVLGISSTKHIKKSSRLLVRISAPNLEGVETSGVAKVSLTDLSNSAFSADSSGASKITLSGVTGRFNVDVSGAAKIDAANLKATDGIVESSGASRVTLNVSGLLKVNASGASQINYSGNPANIEKKTSGAAAVSQE